MDSGGATGGGPAPFLLKTYDMVDDSSNVDVVSWTTSRASFVVWNPPEFASRLLPSYFKHNNFSSFIRQLNTYGFRKIHPERWEFANEDFIQGQKHLLKNIHRRKPIHSHSNTPDHERAALEEEIDRLGREKAALQADLWRFRQHQPGTKAQLDGLDHRLHDMEQRQEKMVAFFQRAVQDQGFVEALVKMAAAGSLDLPAIHKRRRLPGSGQPQEIIDNDVDDSPPKNEIGMVFHRDFCDKLKLELSPAISECNLVSAITQNSNGDRESPQGKLQVRMECLPLVPETLELSDTGTSFCSRKSIFCSGTAEEREGVLPFHLSLTLASSSMQVDVDGCSEEQRMGNGIELRARSEERDANVCKLVEKNQVNVDVDNCANVRELAQSNSPATAAAATTGRVNDMFWEQFLTEKPVSLETAEASSCLPPNSSEQQQEERMAGNESV